MKTLITIVNILLIVACNQTNTQQENIPVASNKPAKVELKKENSRFYLTVNGEKFFINGAGLEFGSIENLASHNANSFRTWRTNNGQRTAIEVLNEAHKYGLMVAMGIEVARERHGFDYNDNEAVATQFENIKKQVEELKDHPALLIWNIGNELNLRYTNTKVWDAVNDISKMIHQIDPNHPTTTCLSGISQNEVDLIKEKCSDLDILSFQMYGNLPELPAKVREYGWEGAYIVTEWGATGHWEVPQTAWNAPIEQNSTIKAEKFLQRYSESIAADSLQCIGSYVFLWGHKQERTPTWYGLHLEDGQETEAVDVMHFIWNKKMPENRCPQILDFTIDGKTAYDNVYLEKNKNYTAKVSIKEPENETVTYKWEIMPESSDLQDGGDQELRPNSIPDLFIENNENTVKFKAPAASGAYRLFIYIFDGNNRAATANIPFFVK